MKKYLLHILIVIMTVSLTGIVIVQLFWIQKAIEVKEAEYDENIREALSSIVKKIERKQTVVFISKTLNNLNVDFKGETIITDKNGLVEYFMTDSSLCLTHDSVGYSLSENVHMNVVSTSSVSQRNIIKLKDSSDNIWTKKSDVADSTNIPGVITITGKDHNTQIATEIYLDVFDDMIVEYQAKDDPVSKLLTLEKLDTLIRKEILEKGFDKAYEYAIINTQTDSVLQKTDGFSRSIIDKSFKTNLFPKAIVEKPIYLYLYLPGKSSFIYNSMSLMLLGSIFFTLVITVIFFSTTRIAFKQKKISEIKSDFINNMTHEFKTPIATISLATDSIKNPKVIKDEQKIRQYLDIIKEENKRMNNQVESVLQMSLLEKEKFKINLSEFDLHELIQLAIQNIQIKITEQNGKLLVDLLAENPFVMVDETHFLNIIHNLLDNAIKYSPDNLTIDIKTRNRNGSMIISIQDRGIGIKREDQVRIFDKFYRVSTGNVHNVKGFGLGLSYVKAIVNEFNGSVSVASEYGKGSQFEITLPVISLNNGK